MATADGDPSVSGSLDGPPGGAVRLRTAGEGIAQSWVVVIQGAHEVLEEHQRKTFGHPSRR